MATHSPSADRPDRPLSRRAMLKLSGALATSSVLAACAPAATSTPAPAKVEGTVVIMHKRHELTEDEEKQFEADNPGIQIELLADDFTRFFAMYAAGPRRTCCACRRPRFRSSWRARSCTT